jgi:hypothetical protein
MTVILATRRELRRIRKKRKKRETIQTWDKYAEIYGKDAGCDTHDTTDLPTTIGRHHDDPQRSCHITSYTGFLYWLEQFLIGATLMKILEECLAGTGSWQARESLEKY